VSKKLNQKERLSELERAMTEMTVLLKHLVACIGDFSHNLSELGGDLMTNMGIWWQALEGKTPEETAAEMDNVSEETAEDSSQNGEDNVVYFPVSGEQLLRHLEEDPEYPDGA
jgi:methyl-accepting chemotaxis protein